MRALPWIAVAFVSCAGTFAASCGDSDTTISTSSSSGSSGVSTSSSGASSSGSNGGAAGLGGRGGGGKGHGGGGATGGAGGQSSSAGGGTTGGAGGMMMGTGGAGGGPAVCDMTTAEDHTADANVDITFLVNGKLRYAPSCIKVKAGATVTFKGDFFTHPLAGGGSPPAIDASSPIQLTQSGMTATFALPKAGTYPYFCTHHYAVGMKGTIFVL